MLVLWELIELGSAEKAGRIEGESPTKSSGTKEPGSVLQAE